jgi:hypothetical protein
VLCANGGTVAERRNRGTRDSFPQNVNAPAGKLRLAFSGLAAYVIRPGSAPAGVEPVLPGEGVTTASRELRERRKLAAKLSLSSR